MAIRPSRLVAGDTVAVLSPSWGGPAVFPHIFDAGVRVLEERLGLRVKEYASTRADPDYLHRNPRVRAEDVNAAFRDPSVRAIVASIGGDDSLRLLPYLDREAIRAHPKVLLGYSDTTTLLTFANQLGLVTFHGPSVMAGLAQLPALPPEFEQHLRALLFEPATEYSYRSYSSFTEGYPDWRDAAQTGRVNPPRTASGWRVLQGSGAARGALFGGCFDVLEFMKGTAYWPAPEFWQGKLLFLETSEEAPPPSVVSRALRNYGVQGVFDQIVALLFGRPRGYSDADKATLEREICAVVAGEFGRADLPIVCDMDFGHTDPQWILPLGVRAELDCDALLFRLLEPAVV